MILIFSCLLCSHRIYAQQAAGEPTDDNESLRLSALFSRQFVMPDAYPMNIFDFDLSYTLHADGTTEVTHVRFTSTVTKDVSDHYTAPGSPDFPAEDIRDELEEAIYMWFDDKDSLLRNLTGIRHVQADTSLETHVYYSPMYFAARNDTLHCSLRQCNAVNTYGEEAAMINAFCIRNLTPTEYYAVLKRSRGKIKLNFYDTLSHTIRLVKHFQIINSNEIVQQGDEFVLADDGKKVRIHQVWDADSLRFAEQYDDDGNIRAKYLFEYQPNAIYPTLSRKKMQYPSKAVMMRAKFDSVQNKIFTYNEDGSPAEYQPINVKNAEKTIETYFRKNFRVPALKKAVVFGDMTLVADIPCAVTEKGELQILPPTPPQTQFRYNYNPQDISADDINELIHYYYFPYFVQFWRHLAAQQFECSPATVDKEAVFSAERIHLECDFTPEWLERPSKRALKQAENNLSSSVADFSMQAIVQQPVTDDDLYRRKRMDLVYTSAEVMPEFPGGKQALLDYLNDHVIYPDVEMDGDVLGRVICSFVVERDGTITNIQVIRSGGNASLDLEAIRVIRTMPKWIPGKHKGKTVRVKYATPIAFSLKKSPNPISSTPIK